MKMEKSDGIADNTEQTLHQKMHSYYKSTREEEGNNFVLFKNNTRGNAPTIEIHNDGVCSRFSNYLLDHERINTIIQSMPVSDILHRTDPYFCNVVTKKSIDIFNKNIDGEGDDDSNNKIRLKDKFNIDDGRDIEVFFAKAFCYNKGFGFFEALRMYVHGPLNNDSHRYYPGSGSYDYDQRNRTNNNSNKKNDNDNHQKVKRYVAYTTTCILNYVSQMCFSIDNIEELVTMDMATLTTRVIMSFLPNDIHPLQSNDYKVKLQFFFRFCDVMSLDASPRSLYDFKPSHAMQLRDFIVCLWSHVTGAAKKNEYGLLHECSSLCKATPGYSISNNNHNNSRYMQECVMNDLNSNSSMYENYNYCLCEECTIVNGYLNNRNIAYVLEPLISNFYKTAIITYNFCNLDGIIKLERQYILDRCCIADEVNVYLYLLIVDNVYHILQLCSRNKNVINVKTIHDKNIRKKLALVKNGKYKEEEEEEEYSDKESLIHKNDDCGNDEDDISLSYKNVFKREKSKIIHDYNLSLELEYYRNLLLSHSERQLRYESSGACINENIKGKEELYIPKSVDLMITTDVKTRERVILSSNMINIHDVDTFNLLSSTHKEFWSIIQSLIMNNRGCLYYINFGKHDFSDLIKKKSIPFFANENIDVEEKVILENAYRNHVNDYNTTCELELECLIKTLEHEIIKSQISLNRKKRQGTTNRRNDVDNSGGLKKDDEYETDHDDDDDGEHDDYENNLCSTQDVTLFPQSALLESDVIFCSFSILPRKTSSSMKQKHDSSTIRCLSYMNDYEHGIRDDFIKDRITFKLPPGTWTKNVFFFFWFKRNNHDYRNIDNLYNIDNYERVMERDTNALLQRFETLLFDELKHSYLCKISIK